MDEKRFEVIYKQAVSFSTEVRILRIGDRRSVPDQLDRPGGGITPLLN